jgi:HD-GYP domain-containing protein (c-di-GMP phosphodiesterase class II)
MGASVKVLESAGATPEPYSVIHRQRVAQIFSALTRERKLEERQVSNLKSTARLEDFGKISAPIGILSMPGKWSGPEREMMKGHPSGWSGEDMLPGSIILGVAAVVDAMSAHHPCEPALVVELALHEIAQHPGIFLDPWIVVTLARLVSGNMFGNSLRDHAC